MENKSAQYKYCIVPGCKSTTVRTSNKHFFTLPKEPKRRLKWLKACRRDKKDISQKSIGLYVCEDHFDLEQDMDNYIKFKIMGGPKIIKSGVVPHIFDCQPDKKRAFSQPVREAALKRVKRQLLEDAASTSKSVLEDNDDKRQCDPSFTNLVQSGPELNQSALPQKLNNSSTQTHIKIRSKGIQCKFQRSVTVGLSLLKIHNKDAGTTPIKD
ncbi:uncharacterized protein LOC126890808 [Diabrotica virgifera virgifera]|uniref:THAP-type domain-containing protein n=1 Tax=Diabrotica virgifera virgifera TaxID=50390 RepID=A0ABM5L0I9_DIAVI|nr:uncharacterized protein LOC126890808 [Diabrotica virgifera virgifera]